MIRQDTLFNIRSEKTRMRLSKVCDRTVSMYPPYFSALGVPFFLRSYCKIYLVWHGHHSVVEVDLRWNDRCKFHRDSWRNRWGGYLFFTDRQGLVNLVVESWGTLVTEDDSFKWKTFGEDVKWWCGSLGRPGNFFFIPASVIYFLVGCGFFFFYT